MILFFPQLWYKFQKMMRLTRAPARLIAYGLVVLSLLLLAYSQKFVEEGLPTCILFIYGKT